MCRNGLSASAAAGSHRALTRLFAAPADGAVLALAWPTRPFGGGAASCGPHGALMALLPPLYLHPLWFSLLVISTCLWLYVVSWCSSDARGIGARHGLVATAMLAVGGVGLLLSLAAHGAFTIFTVVSVVTAWAAYVVRRNLLVPERHRILGAYHRAQLLSRLPRPLRPRSAEVAYRSGGRGASLSNMAGESLSTLLADQPALGEAAEVLTDGVARACTSRGQELRVFSHSGQYVLQLLLDGLPHTLEPLQDPLGLQVITCGSLLLGLSSGGLVRQGEGQLLADRPGQPSVQVRGRIAATEGKPALVVELPDWTADLYRGGLEAVGMHEALVRRIETALGQRRGAVVFSGRPGSGITTTLYAAAAAVDIFTTEMIAVEEQQEHELDQVRHWPLRREEPFRPAFEALMREGPDAMMFGVIRRPDEAKLLLDYADRHGLLLSTIHARSAAEGLLRLVGMTENPELAGRAVTCVLGQQLVRKLCTECRQPIEPEEQFLRTLRIDVPQSATWYKPVGCATCLDTGYMGRIGIFSMLIVTDPVRKVLAHRGATEAEVRQAAGASAFRTIYQDGLTKAMAGITTVEEVRRVVSAAERPAGRRARSGR
jgi:general secretion pathway protein E